jgi:hypothetical protein
MHKVADIQRRIPCPWYNFETIHDRIDLGRKEDFETEKSVSRTVKGTRKSGIARLHYAACDVSFLG